MGAQAHERVLEVQVALDHVQFLGREVLRVLDLFRPQIRIRTKTGNRKSGSGNDSPRRKVRTKKSSPKHNESDSESEEEKETKRKPKKIPKKGKKKKDESEEGEISSNDSTKEEFDDGLDEDLIGDSEDRARLEKMTEREREEELFKRAETREGEKKLFEIQKKLKKEHKLKAKEKPEASEPGEADEEDGEEVNEFAGVENTKNRSQTQK